jgi:hypothetical protein
MVLTIASCKKEEDKAPSSTPPPSSTSMTAVETAMVGHWLWDSTQIWSGGALTSTVNHSTHPGQAGAYIDLKSTKYSGVTTSPQLYDEVFLPSGTMAFGASWKIQPLGTFPKDFFDGNVCPMGTASGSYIDAVTSTTLVLTDWSGAVENGSKHFYHK